MADNADAPTGATVTFLPHRLNRQPVIVRGLTANELWITVSLSGLCGVLVGIVLAWLTHTIAMAPTLMVLSIALGVFLGGSILRRHKRGRPDTWFYRQIQWAVSHRFPRLSAYFDAGDLITRSGYWTTRRTNRRRAAQR